MPEPAVVAAFERSFDGVPIDRAACDRYELAPTFRALADHQPVLEAGSGGGRWVQWLVEQGTRSVGIDWSYALCRDANRAIDGGSFVQGDLLQLPLADHSVGSIISLGAVEHSPEGPSRALAEYARVLRPGGVAVVTVPYLGPARRLARLASWPRARMRTSPAVRRLARKPPVAGTTAAEARRGTRPGWAADYTVGPDGWAFYQYQLTKAQMRACIASAGLGVEREFVEFHDEGVLHTFGRLAGRWDARRQAPRLHPLGQLLSRIMPVGLVGHMLCYVVRPDAGRSCRVG